MPRNFQFWPIKYQNNGRYLFQPLKTAIGRNFGQYFDRLPTEISSFYRWQVPISFCFVLEKNLFRLALLCLFQTHFRLKKTAVFSHTPKMPNSAEETSLTSLLIAPVLSLLVILASLILAVLGITISLICFGLWWWYQVRKQSVELWATLLPNQTFLDTFVHWHTFHWCLTKFSLSTELSRVSMCD